MMVVTDSAGKPNEEVMVNRPNLPATIFIIMP
jgi:hypothetical protein